MMIICYEKKKGDKVLLAGDYEGQIRIFNIGNDRKSRTLDDGTKEMFPPTKVKLMIVMIVIMV